MSQLDLFGGGLPLLPIRVRCLSFWSPYGQLIVDGIKTIETREHARIAPGWCVVHVAQHIDRKAVERLATGSSCRAAHAVDRFITRVGRALVASDAGKLIGLVWFGEPRSLVPADEEAACIYEPGLVAYPLTNVRRLAHPIDGVKGHQGVWFESRERILDALGAPLQ